MTMTLAPSAISCSAIACKNALPWPPAHARLADEAVDRLRARRQMRQMRLRPGRRRIGLDIGEVPPPMLDDPLPHQRLVEIRRQQRQLRRRIPPPPHHLRGPQPPRRHRQIGVGEGAEMIR
jgi:hypothetical protein